MGFYTEYQKGNMVIPQERFKELLEVLPRLCERDGVNAAQAFQETEQQYRSYAERTDDTDCQKWAREWFARPEEQRFLLSVLSVLADGHFHFEMGRQAFHQKMVKGLLVYFGEKKNWSPDLLGDLAPFLLEGAYMQVSDDDGDVRRYVVKDGQIEVIWPRWE